MDNERAGSYRNVNLWRVDNRRIICVTSVSAVEHRRLHRRRAAND